MEWHPSRQGVVSVIGSILMILQVVNGMIFWYTGVATYIIQNVWQGLPELREIGSVCSVIKLGFRVFLRGKAREFWGTQWSHCHPDLCRSSKQKVLERQRRRISPRLKDQCLHLRSNNSRQCLGWRHKTKVYRGWPFYQSYQGQVMLLVILTAVDRLAQAISLKTNASDCILPRHEIRIITSIGES